jgi:hypothetical protein
MIDLGRKISTENEDVLFLKEADGKTRRFYSLTEGLNFLYSCGWKVTSTWVGNSPGAAINTFLFERRN